MKDLYHLDCVVSHGTFEFDFVVNKGSDSTKGLSRILKWHIRDRVTHLTHLHRYSTSTMPQISLQLAQVCQIALGRERTSSSRLGPSAMPRNVSSHGTNSQGNSYTSYSDGSYSYSNSYNSNGSSQSSSYYYANSGSGHGFYNSKSDSSSGQYSSHTNYGSGNTNTRSK